MPEYCQHFPNYSTDFANLAKFVRAKFWTVFSFMPYRLLRIYSPAFLPVESSENQTFGIHKWTDLVDVRTCHRTTWALFDATETGIVLKRFRRDHLRVTRDCTEDKEKIETNENAGKLCSACARTYNLRSL